MTTTIGPGGSSAESRDFESFYHVHRPTVARALGVTIADRELAAEATDEAMARCFSRWETIRRYENPAGWVYRVALNWALSAKRRISVRRRRAVLTAPRPDGPVGDPTVDRALHGLTLDLRSVVVCRLLLDWSVEQTADALNIPQGTVKSRLHRALSILERKLDHLRQETP